MTSLSLALGMNYKTELHAKRVSVLFCPLLFKSIHTTFDISCLKFVLLAFFIGFFLNSSFDLVYKWALDHVLHDCL